MTELDYLELQGTAEAIERAGFKVGAVRVRQALRELNNLHFALAQLYKAFPDCDGGEAGKACLIARNALASAKECITQKGNA